MKALELAKRVQGFCKDNKWHKEKGGKLTVALHIDAIVAELEKPEPTSDAVKILCKRYGTSLAKIATDLEAKNERLKKFTERIAKGQYCGQNDCPAYPLTLARNALAGKPLGRCQGHVGGLQALKGDTNEQSD